MDRKKGVEITTPSRLHFTLIDLHGGLGRIDGGIGVALEEPFNRFQIMRAETLNVPKEVLPIMDNIQSEIDLKYGYSIKVMERVPGHVGLGSNTQASLALLKGILLLEGKSMSLRDMAKVVQRGGTSGIGVWAFESGGFILDSGHSKEEKNDFSPSHFSKVSMPGRIVRYSIPKSWYFVIAVPDLGKGAHGEEELRIFEKHCPIPLKEVTSLSHIILMKTLPAIIHKDARAFGESLTKIQSVGFKKIENDLQGELIPRLYKFMLSNRALGVGLSSFGPSTYALVQGKRNAIELTNRTKRFLKEQGVKSSVLYTHADNKGARIVSF